MPLSLVRVSVRLKGVEQATELLRSTLAALVAVGEADWLLLEQQLVARTYEAGSHLQRAGEPSGTVFFVCRGLAREYYARDDGSERTRGFVREGGFTAAYADFLLERAATVSIEALQETQVLALPLRALEALRRARPVFETVTRRLLEQMYVQKEKREFQFLTLSASQRYRSLAEDLPGLEQLVPQYHVASYLGITPVALSRIRKRSRG